MALFLFIQIKIQIFLWSFLKGPCLTEPIRLIKGFVSLGLFSQFEKYHSDVYQWAGINI